MILKAVHPSQLHCNPTKPFKISLLREIMGFKNLQKPRFFIGVHPLLYIKQLVT